MFVTHRPVHASGQAERKVAQARSWAGTASAVVLLLLAALLLRLPAFPFAVMDPDEGLYLLQATHWLRGEWPYLGVWDMHPPGAPALLLPALALLPDPVLALRLSGVAAVAATSVLLRAIALGLGAGGGAALGAGLLYAAFSTMPGGLATNTEVLFAPFVAACAWLLLAEARRDAPPRIAVVAMAGLAAGVALWVKQVTALESSALWLTLAAVAWRRGWATPARLGGLALAFAAGAGLPSLGVAAGYGIAGTWDAWWQANILAPLTYLETGAPVGDAPPARATVVPALSLLGWLALAALGLLAAAPGTQRAAALLLPWLAAACLAVLAPGKFWDHYFLLPLPPLCVLAALGLGALAARAAQPGWRGRVLACSILVVMAQPVATMLVPRLAHGVGLREPDAATRVAALVTGALRPGEALYVANWHTVTYVLAGAPPPTRFAFPGHLSGWYAAVTGVDPAAELARVLALPPGVIVVSPPLWWRVRPDARALIEARLADGYELVGTVTDGDRGPVEVWRRR